ncbi:MAG: hypothetical protein JXR61_13770 [Prolixibacteraceae bacterium]|nr:hypothetical protein [Prolixibacteraceae bacterium]
MKRTRTLLFFLSVILLFTSCSKEEVQRNSTITIVFYNVENLFDTVDKPDKADEEFTPNGAKEWNEERYAKKINDIAKVLSSVNSQELPEMIGLCEVENRKVLEDLVENDLLKQGEYKIVHYESPDTRGIDNAFIYRPDEFEVNFSQPIPVSFEGEPDFYTRDILYVKGKTNNKEELHIFVNHWPSRIGGTEETEYARLAVATIVKSKIDSIQAQNSMAEIIVMGDMNDEPSNYSLSEILAAVKPDSNVNGLVNLMYPVYDQNLGSYVYQGNWNMLDNIIVSSNLLDDDGFSCTEKKGHVFHQEWMEYKNTEGEISPNKTYGGLNYYGGVSDHFPVYISLKK